jgi:hypothetical protein
MTTGAPNSRRQASAALVGAAELRLLSEVPTLVIARDDQNVLGWDVIVDGERMGTVVDLLVDVDRLRAEYLLVSTSHPTGEGDMLVPVAAFTKDRPRSRLVVGIGPAYIKVRYPSTVALATWSALAFAIVGLILWALGAFSVGA